MLQALIGIALITLLLLLIIAGVARVTLGP